MSSFLSKPVLRAIAEHGLRAGIAAVVGAYLAGNWVFDVTNLHTWEQAGAIFLGALVVSVLGSLGISLKTGTGPALNKAESFETPLSVQRREDGYAAWIYLAIIALIVVVILAITGVI